MTKQTRYSSELRERAVRMLLDQQGDYDSQWAAMSSIATKVGCTTETLRKWVRQAEKDLGIRDGVTSEERDRLKLTSIGDVPPVEYEAAYHQQKIESATVA